MSGVEQLLRTPLHEWHASHGGRMVAFAGWSMPVQYGSIIDEHHQTRTAVGLFDVSHMGRLYFSGSGVDRFLDGLTTRRIAGVEPGRIRYSLMTNEKGGILDDVLVYHLLGADGQPFHMMVVNASNRAKIVDWIGSHLPEGGGIGLDDRTAETAMIAVQGPRANREVAALAELDPDTLKYYTGAASEVAGCPALISRTGYTGEDGCELIVAAEDAEKVWSAVHERAAGIGGGACGLASRDTLRLEAAMPLYGHELNESINAAQTGLRFAIQMKDRTFIGRDAIAGGFQDDSLPVRVGLELEGRRPAREECPILHGDKTVGVVTSGTFAPTLQKSISMGYVAPEASAVGTGLIVDIRGKQHPARVVEMPFYSRD